MKIKLNLLQKNQGKKKFDKKNVQFYNCDKYGHYASECKFNKSKKGDEEANVAQESSWPENEAVTFVSNFSEKMSNGETWYLDTGCSNHMTGRSEWLNNLDTSKRTKVKLADNSYLVAEGMRNTAIQRKDCKEVLIEKVLYILQT
ncbi:retrovirus-related Pol polyprotein from transposon TNT 1-102 [Trifolium medium]|uniref:Retrovirus-related Pol polyprotein from transposon TNT 1-102 n=1 Tax=Trifolium medium TaxID=97028 RepID=A0A392PRC7_9FABA|nr:retrovirus-related Pol polyprotein from transposon TNT 1-102 [Trifolium medium]